MQDPKFFMVKQSVLLGTTNCLNISSKGYLFKWVRTKKLTYHYCTWCVKGRYCACQEDGPLFRQFTGRFRDSCGYFFDRKFRGSRPGKIYHRRGLWYLALTSLSSKIKIGYHASLEFGLTFNQELWENKIFLCKVIHVVFTIQKNSGANNMCEQRALMD